MTLRLPLLLGVALAVLAAPVAGADEIESEPVPIMLEDAPATPEPEPPMAPPLPEVQPTSSAAFEGAIQAWNEERPWSYGTQYLFQLTRGMWKADVLGNWRMAVATLTVPADVGLLPIAALAGLFGS